MIHRINKQTIIPQQRQYMQNITCIKKVQKIFLLFAGMSFSVAIGGLATYCLPTDKEKFVLMASSTLAALVGLGSFGVTWTVNKILNPERVESRPVLSKRHTFYGGKSIEDIPLALEFASHQMDMKTFKPIEERSFCNV